jgi:thiosulfate/3-mercaptopyruvate sulfurtransferase
MVEGNDARIAQLVEPEWLWDHHRDPSVRVIDCGSIASGSSDAYDRAHLPEAVHLPVHGWLKEREFGVHVIGPDELSAIMVGLGVSESTTVVAYDDYNSTFATRLWWVLAHYGHRDVRVLDGGFRRWLTEGRPLSNRPANVRPGSFRSRPTTELFADLDRVRASVGDPDVQILNVLTEDWYHGRVNPWGNDRVGHIPGSVNLPIERFLVSDDDPSFRSLEELQAIVHDSGLVPDRATIIHCQAGVRTALAFFVLTLLGWRKLRAYDASMAEWANLEDTPLAC